MNFFRFIIIVLGVLLLFPSCDEEKPDIVGEWAWVRSTGGLGGQTITSDSVMRTSCVIITNNTFKQIINDSLAFESDYEFQLYFDAFDQKYILIEFEKGSFYEVSIEQEELVLDDFCTDCYRHFYIRK